MVDRDRVNHVQKWLSWGFLPFFWAIFLAYAWSETLLRPARLDFAILNNTKCLD